MLTDFSRTELPASLPGLQLARAGWRWRSRLQPALRALPLVLLIAALWLATHPYHGIAGDARWYNARLLGALHPADYATDLLLADGSQASRSVFTTMFAPVIGWLGLNTGNIALNLGFQMLWLAGLYHLVCGLLPDGRARSLAMVAAIALPGGVNFVQYGEPLLTPQLLAEALSLWALGQVVRGRLAPALLLLLLAASLHPVMALPGIGVLFGYAARRQPVWWAVAALGTLTVAVLVLAGVAPFGRLAGTFDPAWWAAVSARNGDCFVSQWRMVDWLSVIDTLALAVTGLGFARPSERRLLAACLVVAFGGLAAALVGGDLLHLTTVLDAQFWRAFWLLALVANLSVASIVLELRRYTGFTPESPVAIIGLAVLLLALSRFLEQTAVVVAPLVVVGGLAGLWLQRGGRFGQPTRLLLLGYATLGSGASAYVSYAALGALAAQQQDVWSLAQQILLSLACAAALVFAVLKPAPLRRPWYRSFSLPFTLVLGLAAVVSWDQRSAWARFIETAAAPPTSLISQLTPGSTLYWEGDVRVPWLLLRRSSYFSCEQGAGIPSDRDTALKFQQRYDSFRMLGTLDVSRDPYCRGTNRVSDPVGRAQLAALCRREPGLGDVVLTKSLQDEAGAVWKTPVEVRYQVEKGGHSELASLQEFHIYRCADYRPS